MNHRKTAVIDFDNTIAGYDKWRGPKVLGPPVPYARDAITELREWGWRIVVFTTRGNVELVHEWLQENAFPPLLVNTVDHNPPGCSMKPIGEVYFDDRDAHVVGENPYNWHKAMARVRRKYQPSLDSHVDDVQAWAGWFTRFVLAPIERARFRASLEYRLTEREIEANDNLDFNTKQAMLQSLFEQENPS